MKTIEDIKNEQAQSLKFADWDALYSEILKNNDFDSLEWNMHQVATDYASQFKTSEETANKWIAVGERLPKHTGSVLTTDCVSVATGYYCNYWSHKLTRPVTHWMELPAPPAIQAAK